MNHADMSLMNDADFSTINFEICLCPSQYAIWVFQQAQKSVGLKFEIVSDRGHGFWPHLGR